MKESRLAKRNHPMRNAFVKPNNRPPAVIRSHFVPVVLITHSNPDKQKAYFWF